MNIDDAAKQRRIALEDEEQDSLEDELDDVITMLDELKTFETGRRSKTINTVLRDDKPREQDFKHTSDHTDGDTIRSPDS